MYVQLNKTKFKGNKTVLWMRSRIRNYIPDPEGLIPDPASSKFQAPAFLQLILLKGQKNSQVPVGLKNLFLKINICCSFV